MVVAMQVVIPHVNCQTCCNNYAYCNVCSHVGCGAHALAAMDVATHVSIHVPMAIHVTTSVSMYVAMPVTMSTPIAMHVCMSVYTTMRLAIHVVVHVAMPMCLAGLLPRMRPSPRVAMHLHHTDMNFAMHVDIRVEYCSICCRDCCQALASCCRICRHARCHAHASCCHARCHAHVSCHVLLCLLPRSMFITMHVAMSRVVPMVVSLYMDLCDDMIYAMPYVSLHSCCYVSVHGHASCQE